MNSQQKIRVLLADDHSMVRAGIRQFLEMSTTIEVVAEVEDGEAVKTIMNGDLLVDVVMLDIKMPRLNGIELTRWIRANYPEMGILILSAFDDDAYVMAVLNAGANGYMLKSSSPKELETAVISVFNNRSALHPSIAHKVVEMVADLHRQQKDSLLTPREQETLRLAGKGMTNKEIGKVLNISSRTVQSHLANIYQKLDVSNRTEAVSQAIDLNLL